MSMDSLHINHRFLLSLAETIHRINPSARVLDFGCGSGQLVLAAREQTIDCYGAENFYEGQRQQDIQALAKKGALGTIVRRIQDDRIDFPSEYFDLVVNNQVMEHVHDLDSTLREISRVMKPKGILISLFPSKEVFLEGHIGIPMVHWFPKGSKRRCAYVRVCRKLGIGFDFWGDTPDIWMDRAFHFLDNNTVYRTKREILCTFNRYFTVSHIEHKYVQYRLSRGNEVNWPSILFHILGMKLAARVLFGRIAGMVILSRKLAYGKGARAQKSALAC